MPASICRVLFLITLASSGSSFIMVMKFFASLIVIWGGSGGTLGSARMFMITGRSDATLCNALLDTFAPLDVGVLFEQRQ